MLPSWIERDIKPTKPSSIVVGALYQIQPENQAMFQEEIDKKCVFFFFSLFFLYFFKKFFLFIYLFLKFNWQKVTHLLGTTISRLVFYIYHFVHVNALFKNVWMESGTGSVLIKNFPWNILPKAFVMENNHWSCLSHIASIIRENELKFWFIVLSSIYYLKSNVSNDKTTYISWVLINIFLWNIFPKAFVMENIIIKVASLLV